MRAVGLLLLGALLGTTCAARAADPPSDLDALSVADGAKLDPTKATDWRAFLEVGGVQAWPRSGQTSQIGSRLSLDVHYDTLIADGLRSTFSDRLDLEELNHPYSDSAINTVKEAYLSWQITPDEILDGGRINLRYGVATGFNPTDFFRSDAIRSIVSIDPSSLRENRQGSVVLESQTLWEGGSLTALVSPKLAEKPDAADFSADWGATNGSNRWLLAVGQQFGEGFNPQLLLDGEQGKPLQLGLNVTTLLSNAAVAYIEWSGGRAPTLLDQALGVSGPSTFRERAAFGVTYTTNFNLSVTLEHELNTAGIDGEGLSRIVRSSPFALLEFLGFAETLQDLPTRHAEFIYASWQDVGIKHLDLSAFTRFDTISHSRTMFIETRYHFERADLAIQAQLLTGGPDSIFGAVPTQRLVQILLRSFF